jgi:hypothetical protein
VTKLKKSISFEKTFGTNIAAQWKSDSEEAVLPPRWDDTWTDKLPMWLWPKVRILYHILSVCYLLLFAVGLAALIRRSVL